MINVLVSVPYVGGSVRKALGENRQHIRLLIDSGAFTNWKAGKETTVESYMEFLDGLPVKPWRYFALDKIGDPEGTWDNYQKMLKIKEQTTLRNKTQQKALTRLRQAIKVLKLNHQYILKNSNKCMVK